ncbi:MAG: hypothetical protein ACE14P_06570 [Methanotrichaceae archaeon]
MHSRILKLVSESGRRCDNERAIDDVWILDIKQGRSTVNILHHLNKSYILIRFRFDLNENDKKLLKSSLNNTTELSDFEYDLRTAITSQDIYYLLRREKCARNLDIPVGFDIISKVFPFEKDFGIDKFDKAVQNVINFGVLGISFLRTKVISSKELVEMLKSISTSPLGMYG